MHILGLLIAVLAGAGFWWWRMKAAGEAANEAADVAGRIWGKYKRRKFLNKVEDSPLAVIDDPATAAIVLLHVVAAEDGNHGPIKEEAIRNEVVSTMRIDNPVEIITFSKWTASHAVESKSIMMRYGKLWLEALSRDERSELVGMVERVMLAGQESLVSNQRMRLDFLKQRLGLLVH
jgi:uncharacterized tellurite resistance protein B-like protein